MQERNILTGKSVEYYLGVFGLTLYSTKKDIQKAYHKLIKEWHPDKFSNDKQKCIEATEKSKIINDAYYNLKAFIPVETLGYVERIRVKSSNIHSIYYDKRNMILQIQYHRGGIYEYYGVPEYVFNEFLLAESKGKYAIKNICYKFKYKRVE